MTTTAEVSDSTVALDILADTHGFLSVAECTFLADKGYDVKNIYNQVKQLYEGECIIPLNKRNTKNPSCSRKEILSAKPGSPCGKMVSFLTKDVPGRNSVVP